MNSPVSKHFLFGFGMIMLLSVVMLLAPGVFKSFDRALLQQYYLVRGEEQIDSSIVILYFGNDDIAALGGLPLKRSYYALLVTALQEAGASAIGFDLAFTEEDRDHPEFDELFSKVVKANGKVVLSGYFATLNEDKPTEQYALPKRVLYTLPQDVPFPIGTSPETPIVPLLDGAVGFGHTNLGERNESPLFIQSQGGAVSAFFLELLRASSHSAKEDIRIESNKAILAVKGSSLIIPFDGNGNIFVNYTGSISSLRTIPALKFLREFDEWKTSRGENSEHSFKNKIVLIGIIAEGKSLFVQTPFENQFPSIGIHAMLMDNILRGKTLAVGSGLTGWLLAFITGLFVTLMMKKSQNIALPVIGVCFIAHLLASYMLFSSSAYLLPVSQSLTMLLFCTVGFILYKHRVTESTILTIEEEKNLLVTMLKEKEIHLSKLEERIPDIQTKNSKQPDTELLIEIKKYQEEIARLKLHVEDFNPTRKEESGTDSGGGNPEGIIYHHESKMANVISFVKKIAVTDSPVLILGESGTGKEVIANAIHRISGRNGKAFVAVNCGALTETLLESELFGHEKGAFTGALREKAGRFELAHEGTIFLDEIAETSEAFQVKLLRVLQEGTFERVGGTETRKVNVRVIAATNRDIKDEVNAKSFREDLYYRLNVFTVLIPPLRERKEDIPLLVNHFIKADDSDNEVSETVMNSFLGYEWKGNVRELQSVVKHATVLARAEGRTLIRIKDLPKEFTGGLTEAIDIEDQIVESLRSKQFARSAITETAQALGGLNRGTVAEYFRGYCFKVFCENNFDFVASVAIIAGTTDESSLEKVRKRLEEYLTNAIELVDRAKSREENLELSKPKTKNLPQRYHPYFETVVNSYTAKQWEKP